MRVGETGVRTALFCIHTHMMLSYCMALMRMVTGGALLFRLWNACTVPTIRQCLLCVNSSKCNTKVHKDLRSYKPCSPFHLEPPVE